MFDLVFNRETKYFLSPEEVTLDLKHQLFDYDIYQIGIRIKLYIAKHLMVASL